MIKQIIKPLLLLLFLIGLFSVGCKKDDSPFSSSLNLTFSQDSVLFDTVFTQIGSVTKYVNVKNTGNQTLIIPKIYLARGGNSYYRLNVDGQSGKNFENIEIAPGDSIYVFVEVTIDPNNLSNPFVYKDSIVFEKGNNMRDVDLYSVARNCYLHLPTRVIHLNNGGTFSYGSVECNSVWNNDKPHLVFGYALIDSTCTLTINQGTEVYFHQNGGIVADRGGCLKVLGTREQRVIFQGNRMESDYKNIPGQWERIWLLDGSADHEINYAIIKNAFIGVQAEPFAFYENGGVVSNQRKVKISNTMILNCSYAGIFSRFYTIEMGNSVVSNCGNYLLALIYGGSYSFRHCTLANYWSDKSRTTPSVFINNKNENQVFPLDSAYFVNCIIDGSNADEIELDSAQVTGQFKQVSFIHSILKTKLNTGNTLIFKNNKINTSPDFKNVSNFDFQLNSTSPALDFGVQLPNYQLDLNGVWRDDKPDLGAYEFIP